MRETFTGRSPLGRCKDGLYEAEVLLYGRKERLWSDKWEYSFPVFIPSTLSLPPVEYERKYKVRRWRRW